MAAVPGGYSETKDAHDDIQKICDEVRNAVEEKTKKIYLEFKAHKYREQCVAGTNYLIKVYVEEQKYLHLKVWQKLPSQGGECSLISVEENRTEEHTLDA